MAGNGTFQQKNISLLKQKGFESLGSCFIFLKKKIVLGVAHGDPIFAQVGPKNSKF